jgi:hypothetical protein
MTPVVNTNRIEIASRVHSFHVQLITYVSQ